MTATLNTSEVTPAPAGPPRSFLLSLAAVLGVGPFAIDMYLASLPEIGADFAAPSWMVQLTLTGYLIMLGAGQLVAGPVTDAFGRRRPLLLGLTIFIAACLLAAAAPSMAVLVVARMLQGAGAAMAFVVINSAVRDRVSGDAATRAFAVPSQSVNWVSKWAGDLKSRPGMNEVSKNPLRRSTMPLDSGS